MKRGRNFELRQSLIVNEERDFKSESSILELNFRVKLNSGLLNLVNFNFENILGGGQPIKSLAHGIAHFTRCS